MQAADKGTGPDAALLDGSDLQIAIVQARFNAAITDEMARLCIEELGALGLAPDQIRHVKVPGALEIGVVLEELAESDEYDALIALGCIVRGETYHFELVANESGAAVTRVSLDHQLPIANAILTVENEAQARARVNEKSREAARVAVEMVRLLEGLT